tara:strand:- start:43 stop:687 length:645 start_codon:yes stop_codon:yes gene_type:complete
MNNFNTDNRLNFPSTRRNRDSIAEVLSHYIVPNGLFLEIGSGSGEHGVFFQTTFPSIIWQTSDPESAHRRSIISWINYQGLSSKMPDPICLDVENRPWPIPKEQKAKIKGIICINMIHISPWNCTKALFEESKGFLGDNNFLMLYGPFLRAKIKTTEGNLKFDQSLKLKNPQWGLRKLDDVTKIASKNGFQKEKIIEMPANNLSVIYRFNKKFS